MQSTSQQKQEKELKEGIILSKIKQKIKKAVICTNPNIIGQGVPLPSDEYMGQVQPEPQVQPQLPIPILPKQPSLHHLSNPPVISTFNGYQISRCHCYRGLIDQ